MGILDRWQTKRVMRCGLITDVINLAIAGIGFIHAVTRLIVRKGFPACMNAV
jgi:hypothetical protein